MKFGEKLIEEGIINRAQLDAALSHQAQTGQRIGEALLELGYISEVSLLRFLAKEFNTQYVSTQKLAKVAIPPELLEMVPVELAEKSLLFPVLLSPDKKSIGVVTFEPQESRGIEDVRIIAGVEEIGVYVASRDAIRALIKKHYRGDIHAFDVLDKDSKEELDKLLELYSDRVMPAGAIQMEEESRLQDRGPAVAKDEGDGEGEFREPTSSWTKSIEAVRGSSLISDNDFLETLNILVGLVEMHAANMEGHSARVARAVKFISERMGLKETATIHNITAAYLHDLGKRPYAHLTLLGIDESGEYRKRAKRYHLTPSRLFDSVHLPAQVNHILTHLYEAWDGSGLPEQLLQEAIPQGSRIIAAVDAYVDLAYNEKNYQRMKMSPEEALEWIEKDSGRLFDPAVVKLLGEFVTAEVAGIDLSKDSPLILLAEPDAAASSDLEVKLLKEGFKVRVARDSHSAQECITEDPLCAVITEMRLKPDDGFTLLEQIRSRGLEIPVVMVASDPPPEAITRALDGGVFDFLTKPFVPELLIAKLQKELAKATSRAPDTTPPGIQQPAPGGPEDVILTEPPPPDDDEDEDMPTAAEIRLEVDDGVPSQEDEPLPQPRSDSFASVGGSKSRVFAGTLENKYAYNLILALVSKRRSGLLVLRQGEERGEIYFNKGYIFHAKVEDLSQEESFLKMTSWRGCLYRFEQDAQPMARNMKTPTPMLLKIGDPRRE